MNLLNDNTKYFGILSVFFVLVFMSPACARDLTPPDSKARDSFPKGAGNFVFTYTPLANKPVTVYYYKPDNLPKNAPIMILMHGNSRAALNYRKAMIPYAKRYKFLLVVPEFSKKNFSHSRDYHQGGVFTNDRKMKEKKQWTFSIVEPLFRYVKEMTGKKNKGYILYGFSAGSQFVHRYTFFFPDNHALRTISSSAGSYTMPDYQVGYIYGLKNTKIPKENLRKAFAKDFAVVVGDADTVLSRSDLPKSSGANKEGRDRVERAINFYNTSKNRAKQEGVPFNWKLVIVPHVGHNNADMAGPVAKLLFE